MSNPVVHFEIVGRDGERLEKFYGELFDWSMERRDAGGSPYRYIKTGGDRGLQGGIRQEPEGEAEVLLYVGVADLEASVAKALELGATVQVAAMEFEDIRFAVVNDPEGNSLGLIEQD